MAANYATIRSLNAATARISSLEANYANIHRLVADKATINDVTAYLMRADAVHIDSLYTTYIENRMAIDSYKFYETSHYYAGGSDIGNYIYDLRKRIEALEKKIK